VIIVAEAAGTSAKLSVAGFHGEFVGGPATLTRGGPGHTIRGEKERS